MLWGKKVLRASAVILVAVAASHAAETLKSSSVTGSLSIHDVRSAKGPTATPDRSDSAVPQSASLAAPGKAGLEDVTGITSVAATTPESGSDACEPTLDLQPAPEAMITLQLMAPCNPNERVVIRQSGLSFTARTGPTGMLVQALPALRTDALVAVYLPGSRLVMGQAHVPDAANFTRFAMVWEPPAEFQLRVTEGDKLLIGGDLPAIGAASQVIALGLDSVQSPVLASIYSVAGSSLAEAQITAELRITSVVCGRTLRVTTLLASKGKLLKDNRSVAVPLCGTSGDILVLKNLAPALTLASPK